MQVANWLSKQSLRKIYSLIASGITNAVAHHEGFGGSRMAVVSNENTEDDLIQIRPSRYARGPDQDVNIWS